MDRLDHRTLLSGATVLIASMVARDSPLSIQATSPAPSSVLSASPSSITINFDRSIDPFSLGTSDFELDHQASNGSTTPLGLNEATLNESLDPLATQIILTPSVPLTPGNYQLRLAPGQAIRGLDGTALASDKVDNFSVGTIGLGLSGAAELGVPTSTLATVSGSLSLSASHDAVDLYKVEIPAGQFDRLGLEVSSTRDGGSLRTILSLFDSSGHLISTSNTGRPDFPFDPYLFAGVPSGTYYVGISGAGNMPGTPGGYNPAVGLGGTSGQLQAGGAYRLHFVADAVTAPTQVLGARVVYADPESTEPTGVAIQFSGPIQASGLGDPSKLPLQLVDSNGLVWPITTTNYNESTARLTLSFDQSLPAGSYSIEMTGPRTVHDLAGLVPVARGESPGVFGTVAISGGVNSPGDLGALFPGVVSTGMASTVSIPAGGSVTEKVTVLEGGTYAIRGLSDQVGLTLTAINAGSANNLPLPSSRSLGVQDLTVTPGVYELSFTNSGSSSVTQKLTISRKANQLDSFLESGVGQGPALGLRLVSPQAFASDNSTATGIDPQPASEAVLSVSTTPGGSSPAGPSNYAPTVLNTALPGFISVGTPFGRPTVQSQYISVVGPPGNDAGASMSSNDTGLPGGAKGVPVSISLGTLPKPVEISSDAPTLVGSIPNFGPESSLGDGRMNPGRGRTVDELILTDASWIEKIVGWTMAKLDRDRRVEIDQVTEEKPDLGISERPTVVEAGSDSRLEVASMASPIGLGLAVIVAIRYRKRRDSGNGDRRGANTWTPSRHAVRGPRAFRGRSR